MSTRNSRKSSSSKPNARKARNSRKLSLTRSLLRLNFKLKLRNKNPSLDFTWKLVLRAALMVVLLSLHLLLKLCSRFLSFTLLPSTLTLNKTLLLSSLKSTIRFS